MKTTYKPLLLLPLLIYFLFTACSKSDPVPDPLENDSTPPKISLAIAGLADTPVGGNEDPPVVSTEITVEIDARDANGIDRIEAFIDNNKVGEDTSAPFRITIDLSNYQSKGIKLNKTQTLYKLTITATDNAGNQSSVEQLIIVDNEMPVISNVSLASGTTINGSINEITFFAEDNSALEEVSVLVNGSPVTTVQDSLKYSFNLDTTVLDDGLNNLVIEAKDQANNIASHEVGFVSDNTGPVITTSDLTDNQILDSELNFNAVAEDEFSGISLLGIVLNQDTLAVNEVGKIENLLINPENINTGETKFNLFASDSLGNKTELTISTVVKRLLLTVETPDILLFPGDDNFWAFASDSTGTTLAVTKLGNSGTYKLHAENEFDKNQTFMMTFLEINGSPNEVNNVVTYHNLSRNKIQKIYLNNNELNNSSNHVTMEMVGVPANIERIFTEGKHHFGGRSGETSFSLSHKYAIDQDSIYILSKESSTDLKYRSVAVGELETTILDYSEFSNQGILNKQIDFGGISSEGSLELYGFSTLENKENNSYHSIYQNGLFTDWTTGLDDYQLIDRFEYYRHRLSKGDFVIEADGLPFAQYVFPDWTLSWTDTGSSILVNSTGSGHTTGKLFAWAENAPYGNFVEWIMIFDSTKATEVVYPEIPEVIESQLTNYLASNQLTVDHLELNQYPQASTYETYLKDIITNGRNAVEYYGGRTGIFKVKGEVEGPIGHFLPDYFNTN